MAQLPTFAAGAYEKIQPAIDSGVLTYPAYVYIRDKKGLAFIDQDLSINEIVGNNPESVEKVSELPSVEEAKDNVLYIMDGIVYVFDGTEFKPMYKDVTDELETIKSEISALDERVTELEGKPGLVFDTKENFPNPGKAKTLYVAEDEPGIYMWDEELADYISATASSTSTTIQWVEL